MDNTVENEKSRVTEIDVEENREAENDRKERWLKEAADACRRLNQEGRLKEAADACRRLNLEGRLKEAEDTCQRLMWEKEDMIETIDQLKKRDYDATFWEKKYYALIEKMSSVMKESFKKEEDAKHEN